MNSVALPSFWTAYRALDEVTRRRAKKAYRLWAQNPFHPSLRFKCINQEEGIWTARITLGCRAFGILEGDTITWFWIGGHDDYERFFG